MINRDYFCEKLTQIVHMGAKMCKKNVCRIFWIYDSIYDKQWGWSLSKLCIVERCETSGVKPFFPLPDQAKSNETQTRQCFAVWVFLLGFHFEAFQSNGNYGYRIAFIWAVLGLAIKHDNCCGKLRKIVHLTAVSILNLWINLRQPIWMIFL